jgi:prophage maintenance system killer protein
MNGFEIQADVDTQEAVILAVAASEMDRQSFLEWLHNHVVQR